MSGWDEAPLYKVTRSYVAIHHRILEDPALADPKSLAEWLRERMAEVAEKRRRTPRKYLSPRIRSEIFAAFGDRCVYCDAADVPLELDHRIPISRGGPDTIDNLVPACKPCNLRKFNHAAESWPMVAGRR